MSRPEQTSRLRFLKTIIREYYRKKPLEGPPNLHKREIALESLEDGVYIRHLAFPYMDQLYNYILNIKTPLHLYYSSALYSNPSAQLMEDKMWEGSELLFDIDADKYPECAVKVGVCSSGEVVAEGVETCGDGSKPLEYSNVPWSCIKRAWRDALKLVEILQDELGFKEIRVFFSGNRGFHVKVSDEKALVLTRDERRHIASYVSCEDLRVDRVFPSIKGMAVFGSTESGLRKRVLEEALRRNVAAFKERAYGLRSVYLVRVEDLDAILRDECISIDKAVTMDTSRLSRFNYSLNMKAGLRVTSLDLNSDIENMSYRDFSPFTGTVKIKPTITADLEVLDEKLSLVRGEVVKVEAYLGVYLIVKNIATPVDVSDIGVKT
jgi:DNA primase small subunit